MLALALTLALRATLGVRVTLGVRARIEATLASALELAIVIAIQKELARARTSVSGIRKQSQRVKRTSSNGTSKGEHLRPTNCGRPMKGSPQLVCEQSIVILNNFLCCFYNKNDREKASRSINKTLDVLLAWKPPCCETKTNSATRNFFRAIFATRFAARFRWDQEWPRTRVPLRVLGPEWAKRTISTRRTRSARSGAPNPTTMWFFFFFKAFFGKPPKARGTHPKSGQ